MKTTGMVKEIKGRFAVVVADPQTSCSSCVLNGNCASSSYGGEETDKIFQRTNSIAVLNEIGALPNEVVLVEYDEQEVNKGILVVYGVPLLFIIFGVILGAFLENKLNLRIGNLENFTTVIVTIIFLLISVALVRAIDKTKKPVFKITEILVRRK